MLAANYFANSLFWVSLWLGGYLRIFNETLFTCLWGDGVVQGTVTSRASEC